MIFLSLCMVKMLINMCQFKKIVIFIIDELIQHAINSMFHDWLQSFVTILMLCALTA